MKKNTENPNLLIVDDSEVNILLVKKILSKTGANLISAESGAEALAKVREFDFALILLDIQMPGMSGFEVAKHLRDDEKGKNIPIIFLTAIDREKEKELRGYDLGAVDFMYKPVNSNILKNKVNVFLRLYKNHIFQQSLIHSLKDKNKKLNELQSQLIQSEKMSSIGQLAAGVAHEINNPIGFVGSNINSLSGYVNDLKGLIGHYAVAMKYFEDKIKDSKASQIFTKIADIRRNIDVDFIIKDIDSLILESNDGIDRVINIVKNLKDFSHVDQSELKIYNLNMGIESTLKIVHNELKYKAEVTKDFGDIPEIKCYPQQLNQVFMNLFVNAGQAITEKGKIIVKSSKVCMSDIIKMQQNNFMIIPVNLNEEKASTDEYILVSVKDTGAGISKENLSKIFDPFFTTKDIGKGTGLGLSVSFDIIKNHNGAIGVFSEVGKGSNFIVCLPVENEL